LTALSYISSVHINPALEFRALLETDHRSLHISVNHRRRQECNFLLCEQVTLDLTFDADEFPVEITCQMAGLTHRDVVLFQFYGPFHATLDRQILLAGNLTIDTDQFANDG